MLASLLDFINDMGTLLLPSIPVFRINPQGQVAKTSSHPVQKKKKKGNQNWKKKTTANNHLIKPAAEQCCTSLKSLEKVSWRRGAWGLLEKSCSLRRAHLERQLFLSLLVTVLKTCLQGLYAGVTKEGKEVTNRRAIMNQKKYEEDKIDAKPSQYLFLSSTSTQTWFSFQKVFSVVQIGKVKKVNQPNTF